MSSTLEQAMFTSYPVDVGIIQLTLLWLTFFCYSPIAMMISVKHFQTLSSSFKPIEVIAHRCRRHRHRNVIQFCRTTNYAITTKHWLITKSIVECVCLSSLINISVWWCMFRMSASNNNKSQMEPQQNSFIRSQTKWNPETISRKKRRRVQILSK